MENGCCRLYRRRRPIVEGMIDAARRGAEYLTTRYASSDASHLAVAKVTRPRSCERPWDGDYSVVDVVQAIVKLLKRVLVKLRKQPQIKLMPICGCVRLVIMNTESETGCLQVHRVSCVRFLAKIGHPPEIRAVIG